MRVESSSGTSSYVPASKEQNIETVKANLEALAKQHNTSVDGLVEGAKAAGSAGAPYQIRALNLQARLEKLEG